MAAHDVDVRAARSRDAVLAAARALLHEEGPIAVTHQRVAQRAGVGRATVYRHWPRPELLLQDALVGADLPFFAPDAIEPSDADGDGQDARAAWLVRDLRRLADDLSQPTVTGMVAALLQAAQRDPVARGRLDQWLDQIDRRLRTAGVDTDNDVTGDAASLLIGPLLYRAVLQAAPVSDALIDRVVSVALRSSLDGGRS